MAENFEDLKEVQRFNTDEEDFDTVMKSDISFTGNVILEKSLFVKGRIIGRIHSTSDVLIDTDSEVNAEIVSDRVYVRGCVVGDISATRLVYIAASGTVKGDIAARQVVLEPGSNFSGKCTMTK